MVKYIFMTEEKSMEVALKFILPKIDDIFMAESNYRIIPHEGKQDLEKSIPRKLKAWKDNKDTQYRFIILRDKDSGDCIDIKERLRELCEEAGRGNVLIRIVVHELESWFLGDLKAIESAFNVNIAKQRNNKKYRDPDRLSNPSQVLSKLVKKRAKTSRAKLISSYLDIEDNNSKSFNVFIDGVRALLK